MQSTEEALTVKRPVVWSKANSVEVRKLWLGLNLLSHITISLEAQKVFPAVSPQTRLTVCVNCEINVWTKNYHVGSIKFKCLLRRLDQKWVHQQNRGPTRSYYTAEYFKLKPLSCRSSLIPARFQYNYVYLVY